MRNLATCVGWEKVDRNLKYAFTGALKLDRNGLGGPLILQLQRQGRVNDHQVADGGSPRINFVGPQLVSKVSIRPSD